MNHGSAAVCVLRHCADHFLLQRWDFSHIFSLRLYQGGRSVQWTRGSNVDYSNPNVSPGYKERVCLVLMSFSIILILECKQSSSPQSLHCFMFTVIHTLLFDTNSSVVDTVQTCRVVMFVSVVSTLWEHRWIIWAKRLTPKATTEVTLSLSLQRCCFLSLKQRNGT